MPYFDHNATTPLLPAAREAWLRAAEEAWQNPSSPYREAAHVRIRLDVARERLGELLGAPPERVVFNSGATEGVAAVLGYWAKTLPPTCRVAIAGTEHPCVLEAAELWFPGRIAWLPVSSAGQLDLEQLARVLGETGVGAVAAMAANNETGVLHPWLEIASLCRRHGAEFLCDASQWAGKLPAAGLGGLGWVTGSAHKFGGPKGVGFLSIAPRADGFSWPRGGGQERGHRGGTENYPGIAGMVTALIETEQKKMFLETERVRWRKQFELAIAAAVPGTRVIAAEAERLWNTVSLQMPFGENHRWVTRLDKRGVQVSTGSACATGRDGPSHVLAAMGFSPEEAKRTVRISAGWETTEEDWRALPAAFAEVAKEVAPAAAVVKL